MQNDNIFDLRKLQSEKKTKAAEEAEYSAKSELFRLENQEKMRRAAELSVEAEREKNIFRSASASFFARPKNFWDKLGKSFLYILIFLLPLFFLPTTISPIDANKQLLAAFLVAASLICYLANFYLTRKIIYTKSILVVATAALVISTGVSAFFSVSPTTSVFGDFAQPDFLISFIIYVLAFYLAAVFFKKEDFNKIGIVFLASVILLSVLSLLQLFGLYIFPFDFAKQPGFNVFGSVINFVIFIAFGLTLIVAALAELDISPKTKVVLVLAGLLGALNLILINYQPVWILLAITMLVHAAYKFAFRHEGSPSSLIGGSAHFLVGIIAFLFALVGPSLPKVVNLPNLLDDIKPNFYSTLNVSQNALKGFRILTGTGLATFSYQYDIWRPAELNQSDFWRTRLNQGFSFVGTYLTTAGLIGVLSILFIILAFARLAVKNAGDKKALVVSLGLFFVVLGWFYFPASFTGLLFSFIALGTLAALDSDTGELDLSRAAKIRVVAGFVSIIVLVAGAASLFYLSGKKYAAAFYFQNGLKEYIKSDAVKSEEDILKAISLDWNNDQYLRSASQLMIANSVNSRDASVELNKDAKFQSKIADAVQLAKRATEVNPANAENWYNLGDVYEKIVSVASGADSFAANSYQKAADLSPKNPDPLIGEGRVLMFAARQAKDDKNKQEKTAAAIDVLEKAVKLKADYAAGYYQLGMAYEEAQRKDDAIKGFEAAKLLSSFDAPVNFQLGMLYYNSGDFDKAETEMEDATKIDPNFSNARYVLGLIYDKKGRKDDAIAQFEAVLKLNPDSIEVKDILNNLKTKGSAFASEKSVSSESVNQSLGLPESNQDSTVGTDRAKKINNSTVKKL